MYNIKAVAKILEMPSVTIRSWETRYQAIIPERTESGHRVYTEEHVHDLKWIKKQVENGVKVSQAVKLLKERKANEEALKVETRNKGFEPQIQQLYDAVEGMDPEKCDFLLDLYFSQFHYKTVFLSIVVPLIERVRQALKKGELYIAKEHMISHIVLQRSFKFFRIFGTSSTLPKVMAICPEGEHDQFGLVLITLFLREKQYPVYYIGPDTPLEGLGELILQKNIEMVALSISTEENESLIERYIEILHKQNPKLKFLVSGLGIRENRSSAPRWDFSPSTPTWTQLFSELGT